MNPNDNEAAMVSRPRAWFLIGTLVMGYIGIYLCRKNLSVAVPLIQNAFGVGRAEVGILGSVSTLAYLAGKILLCPLVDRMGGRRGFLISLILVAVFGALGALAPSLLALTVVYSFNRFFGAAGWGSMVKMVPDWFPKKSMALAMGVLSLSFVVGGVLASMLAGVIVRHFHTWQAVMGLPSVVLLGLVVVAAFILPKDAPARKDVDKKAVKKASLSGYFRLFRNGQFLVVCALSFTLTLMRETFNMWTVDYLHTLDPGGKVSDAAFLSTLFDALGIVGILGMGWLYGRLGPGGRRWTLCGIMLAVGAVLASLPTVGGYGVGWAAVAVGAVGLLVYGPYSLLAGVLSVEVEGKERAATVSGLVDAAGYLAGVVSGWGFGQWVDNYGYNSGMRVLALLMALSGGLCLMLFRRKSEDEAGA
jgi:sugar phosphate permease